MAAVEPKLTDLESIQVMIDATANELQGLAWMFCNLLKPSIEKVVTNPEDLNQVKNQATLLKSVLCGYTAKESAIAELINAFAKKEAVEAGIDPTEICSKANCKH